MSKRELYRNPADENPIKLTKVPKEPLEFAFPITTSSPGIGSLWKFVFQLYLVAAAALLLPFTLRYEATIIGLLVAYGVARYLWTNYQQIRPDVATHVFSTMLAVYFCYLGILWGFPVLLILLLGSACFYTAELAADFRKHWIAMACCGMLPKRDIDAFEKHGKLPTGVHRRPLVASLLAAFKSWVTYDPADCKAPGVKKSPSGQAAKRVAKTMTATILWAGLLVFVIRDTKSLTLLPLLLLVPVFCPLACMALAAASIAGKAYAMQYEQFSSERWTQFTKELQQSKNTIAKKSIYLGRVSGDGSPVLYPAELLMHGGWIQGPPGSGKTVFLMQLVDQLIRQGYSVVIMDLKATSHELLWVAEESAESVRRETGRHVPVYPFTSVHGRASHLFDLYSQSFWQSLSPEQRASCMMGAFGLSLQTVYPISWFRDAAWSLQQHVTSKYPNIKSFHEAAQHYAREIQFAQGDWELSQQVKKYGEHPRLIVQRLGLTDAVNVRPTYSQEVIDGAIDLESLFHVPSVLHCSLPAVSDPVTNPEIGRVVLDSLLHAGAHTKNPKVNAVVLLDEYQRMISRSLDIVLQQGRSSGVGVILTNQTSADLIAADENMPGTISGVTALQAWIKATDFHGVQQVQTFGGQYIEHLHSKSVTHTGEGRNTTYTATEHLLDRCSSGLIDRVNSTPGQYFLRLNDDGGYAAYGGQMMVVQSGYHMTKERYDELVKCPWPNASRRMLVNGAHRPPKGPPSSALTGPRKPKSPRTPTPLNSPRKSIA